MSITIIIHSSIVVNNVIKGSFEYELIAIRNVEKAFFLIE